MFLVIGQQACFKYDFKDGTFSVSSLCQGTKLAQDFVIEAGAERAYRQ